MTELILLGLLVIALALQFAHLGDVVTLLQYRIRAFDQPHDEDQK